jgi:hypothetical protein
MAFSRLVTRGRRRRIHGDALLFPAEVPPQTVASLSAATGVLLSKIFRRSPVMQRRVLARIDALAEYGKLGRTEAARYQHPEGARWRCTIYLFRGTRGPLRRCCDEGETGEAALQRPKVGWDLRAARFATGIIASFQLFLLECDYWLGA